MMDTANKPGADNWKKSIVLFLSSQTISLFGSSLVQYAMLWHITLSTESGLLMTFYILCGFLPAFLLSPVAGVWADRYPRKRLIILADGAIALATLILAIIFLAGYEAIWLFFFMAAVRAAGTGIQTPAVGAVLPQIVPREQLTKVNGLNSSLQALITFAGPMVSAALLTLTSIEVIFFVDVITAALAILILLTLPIPVHEKAADKQATGYFHDLRKGLGYIQRHDYLKQLFLFFAVFFVLLAPAAFLTPLQVARSFEGDVWRLTAIEVAFSCGMIAGGGIIAVWGGFSNKIHTMALASLIMGGCTIALGVVPVFWIYLLFLALFGIVMPVFNTPTTVLLQEKVDEAYMGRVMGVFGMISSSMMPFGMLIFGPIADVVKIEWLLVVSGLLLVMLTGFLRFNKVLLAAGKAEPKAPSP